MLYPLSSAVSADQREAVPAEVLSLVAVVRRRKLPVGVIRIGVCLVPLGHRHHLVEIAVGVGLGALLDETASGVVGVGRGYAGGGTRRDGQAAAGDSFGRERRVGE